MRPDTSKGVRIEHDLLQQHDVAIGCEPGQVALPAGVLLLVKVPGDEADRLRIEARIRSGVRLCGARNLAAAPDRLHDDGPVVVLQERAGFGGQRKAAGNERRRDRQKRHQPEPLRGPAGFGIEPPAITVGRQCAAAQSPLRNTRPSR